MQAVLGDRVLQEFCFNRAGLHKQSLTFHCTLFMVARPACGISASIPAIQPRVHFWSTHRGKAVTRGCTAVARPCCQPRLNIDKIASFTSDVQAKLKHKDAPSYESRTGRIAATCVPPSTECLAMGPSVAHLSVPQDTTLVETIAQQTQLPKVEVQHQDVLATAYDMLILIKTPHCSFADPSSVAPAVVCARAHMLWGCALVPCSSFLEGSITREARKCPRDTSSCTARHCCQALWETGLFLP